MAVDTFSREIAARSNSRRLPDRWDITGSIICLLGVAVIMFAPRNGS